MALHALPPRGVNELHPPVGAVGVGIVGVGAVGVGPVGPVPAITQRPPSHTHPSVTLQSFLLNIDEHPGSTIGDLLGLAVGDTVGDLVGAGVTGTGALVGVAVGDTVGALVGAGVAGTGALVGVAVGDTVGALVGAGVAGTGALVGVDVGDEVAHDPKQMDTSAIFVITSMLFTVTVKAVEVPSKFAIV